MPNAPRKIKAPFLRALGFFDTSNDGAASGLDADLLDGNHAAAFAGSGHNHDGDYDALGAAAAAQAAAVQRSNHTGTQAQSTVTNLTTDLAAKQATITGGATTIATSDLTASRALASDGSGKVAVSAVTATEIGYVSGVTSAVQTQLNAKAASSAISNVDNTSDASKNAASATLTNKTLGSGCLVPTVIQIAASDTSTDITAGNDKVTFRMPHAMVLTAVRASVNTAPAGSGILINIKESGTTILSTKLPIDASAKTSVGAGTPAVISDSALADDAEMTIDFDQVGSSTPGKGVVITLIGTRTL